MTQWQSPWTHYTISIEMMMNFEFGSVYEVLFNFALNLNLDKRGITLQTTIFQSTSKGNFGKYLVFYKRIDLYIGGKPPLSSSSYRERAVYLNIPPQPNIWRSIFSEGISSRFSAKPILKFIIHTPKPSAFWNPNWFPVHFLHDPHKMTECYAGS